MNEFAKIFCGVPPCERWVKSRSFGVLLCLRLQGRCGEWPYVMEWRKIFAWDRTLAVHFVAHRSTNWDIPAHK
jgi:hypothetical protein